MKLVIVESPAKAKTIERFLGPGYKVAASYGHIRDLPRSAREIPEAVRNKPWGRLAVDTTDGFRPVYIVPEESRKYVRELNKLLKGADEILLATDEDREGESISWHLVEVLKPSVPVGESRFTRSPGPPSGKRWPTRGRSTGASSGRRRRGVCSTGCSATACPPSSGRRCAPS